MSERAEGVRRRQIRKAFFEQGSELPSSMRMADALDSLGLPSCSPCCEAYPDLCEPCATIIHGPGVRS